MTTPHTASSLSAGAPADTSRRGRLALCLQEALTTVARLRANKQVATDAEDFRGRIKQVLSTAEQDARAQAYSADDARYALFAVIALLDETVLNSGQPMFASWSSRTLQEEIFGVHMAGELFFQYLHQLLARQDSPDLADVLEVYSLALLLGFKGRFSATHGGDLQVAIRQVTEKIDRTRGQLGELSPRWRPSVGDIIKRRDRWVPRLAIAAVVLVVISIGFFAVAAISLRSGAADLRTETARLSR
jgi:type VI secretion system protein ImpK